MTHNMAYVYMNDWPEKLGVWANWKITHSLDAHLDWPIRICTIGQGQSNRAYRVAQTYTYHWPIRCKHEECMAQAMRADWLFRRHDA
jgi:hypothetical protein